MDGLLEIVRWATGSIQGIAFVEYIILGLLAVVYQKLNKLETKVDNHEKDCIKQFAGGSTKMALLDERIRNLISIVKKD